MAKIQNKSFEEVEKIYSQYLSNDEIKKVDSAYELAKKLHSGQMRKSGEEYIMHPIQVVSILATLKMDADTLVSGFLHDVIEDTQENSEQIRDLFGEDVSTIVDGVTKLNKISYNTEENQLAENHQKLLLAMSKDVRVIIVKLADRLHNMRTLSVHREEKQKRIANETLEIYAPLAHRLGLATIKWELEDLSLRYINPQAYKQIAELMNSKRAERINDIKQAIEEINESIKVLNIKHVEVVGRPKHLYSIYRKMNDKNKQFNEIYDLLAIRILVDTVAETYAVLGSIHAKWKPMPGRFKDYIALPKPNGYQSLHTTVIGPNGRPLEVQIRTFEMHEVAEFGVAAHWAYKKNKSSIEKANVNTDDQRHLNVIQSILELQDENNDAETFVESVKGDLFSDRVYAFTPKGDVFELPEGSGPLDMAFAVHTDVGLHTVGSKINGRIVPLDHKIHTGDIVEITTSTNAKASRDWLNLVVSRRAKNKIRAYFRQQDRSENIEAGKQMIQKYIFDNKLPTDPKLFDDEHLNKLAEDFHMTSGDDLLASVGYGDLAPQRVANKLTEELREQIEQQKVKEEQEALFSGDKNVSEELTSKGKTKNNVNNEDITIAGIDSLLIHLGRCCTPVPGDEIAGYITKGRGVSVHRMNCRNMQVALTSGERVIAVEWNNPEGNRPNHDADIIVYGNNRDGLLNDIVRSANANTHYINSINGRVEKEDVAVINLTVGVKNKGQLERLIDNVKNVKDIFKVERAFH
ncbi:MAG: bifunctional (p)ppGpp synthetase/guanosine-3',5'-bis(diphosphate) 3'-pyrophosphohydrolase [Lactobacillaceae bacterium]|jgi:GTP pyrophosphokinase|nr:bifunctional (p)ppGpp synthetase/guanosine-3',5'-bis(diphosphate) 3'-pyrophosphohydrolase [Lactobacillaceae bacterium]